MANPGAGRQDLRPFLRQKEQLKGWNYLKADKSHEN
jgi:hypothetical protein